VQIPVLSSPWVSIETISVYLKEKTFIESKISALPGGSRRIGSRLGAGGQHAFFVLKYYLPAAERARFDVSRFSS